MYVFHVQNMLTVESQQPFYICHFLEYETFRLVITTMIVDRNALDWITEIRASRLPFRGDQ